MNCAINSMLNRLCGFLIFAVAAMTFTAPNAAAHVPVTCAGDDGSTRNGVTTSNYGRWDNSYRFVYVE